MKPMAAAASAGLQYVTDRMPGITRHRRGSGFMYVSAHGSTIHNARDLQRIKSLAIPPAWRDVWICPNRFGHLQAAGRDARGRKQYRYHPLWREVRDQAKYDRILDFAAALPHLRHRTRADLMQTGLSRRKVVAAVVQLLEKTMIRVGNEEYARLNHSFGLTTMRDGHARISGGTVRFRFKGKSNKFHDIALNDSRLAAIVRKCQELPGHHLFQYIDDQGSRQDIGSADVNQYLREVTGQDFTAKDFRTWTGTVLAAHALGDTHEFASQSEAKRNVLTAVDEVSGILGNTRSVCRSSYVHPAIIDAYLDRSLATTLRSRAARRLPDRSSGLSHTEAAVLALLQRRMHHDAQQRSA